MKYYINEKLGLLVGVKENGEIFEFSELESAAPEDSRITDENTLASIKKNVKVMDDAIGKIRTMNAAPPPWVGPQGALREDAKGKETRRRRGSGPAGDHRSDRGRHQLRKEGRRDR